MKIVCDSGSTKADWVVLSQNEAIYTGSTKGINPVFHDGDFVRNELRKDIAKQIKIDKVEEVFFYGAGCWDLNLKNKIKSALTSVFSNAEAFVEHDLLGAARAVCGNRPGIACILGTGSNSCLYDGKNVTDNVKNLGFLVGDEGSGSYLGKELLRSYFYRELPDDLSKKLEKFIPGGKSEVLAKIYGGEAPNVYLASHAKFLSDNKSHPFVYKIVRDAFQVFIKRHVCKYKGHETLPVSFIGSVAYYFSDVLENVLSDQGMKLGVIVKKPIESLVRFHEISN